MAIFSYRSISILILLVLPLTIFSQIPNPGFEQWSGGNPVDWFCSNIPPFGTPVTQITPGHGGSWAVRGEVITSTLGDTMLPLLTSGSSAQGFPVTARHNELNGYYKFSPIGGDVILIAVLMYHGNVSVGGGVILISTGAPNFTQLSVPVNYTSSETSDKCVIQFGISNSQPIFHPGSYFIIDDLSLSTTTDIQNQPITMVPADFELLQNYPKPFNPTTEISYQLPVLSEVQLTILNSLGQEIKTLVSEIQSPGKYAVRWDGSKESGQLVASGIYLYRLFVHPAGLPAGQDFAQSRKMIFLK